MRCTEMPAQDVQIPCSREQQQNKEKFHPRVAWWTNEFAEVTYRRLADSRQLTASCKERERRNVVNKLQFQKKEIERKKRKWKQMEASPPRGLLVRFVRNSTEESPFPPTTFYCFYSLIRNLMCLMFLIIVSQITFYWVSGAFKLSQVIPWQKV